MSETDSEVVVQGESLSLDFVFELLASSRRRLVLYRLNEARDGTAKLEDLARYISVYENESSLESIQLALEHTHLPKLVAAGIVEFDPRSDTIRYWSHPSIEEWLEHANHIEHNQCC
ncbi:MAG: hypothetical protein U5K37_03105 [Natrialbaceae archaeon]|nr:hypothetical protein [Natrialbaceae archaeon]